jgi:hypothetical protein
MAVLQQGKHRGPNSEPLVRSCAADGCGTQLSQYNPARCCCLHQGWDLEPGARPSPPHDCDFLTPGAAEDHPLD